MLAPHHLLDRVRQGSAINPRRVSGLTHTLANSLEMGTPLVEALRRAQAHEIQPAMRGLEAELMHAMEAGCTFGEAIERHPGAFDGFYVSLAKASELNDTLGEALLQLATLFRRRQATRRKLLALGVYFWLAAVLLLSAVWCLLGWVNAAPFGPDPARIAGGLSLALFATAPLFVMSCLFVGARPRRWLAHDLAPRFPVIGGALHALMLARSVRVIGMLLSRNVPILQALEVAQMTAQNRRMRCALKAWRELTKEGGDFTAPLVGLGFEPPPLQARIEGPEDPGSLPGRLLNFADCLDEKAQEALDNWLFWAIPVCLTMLITVGLLLRFAP